MNNVRLSKGSEESEPKQIKSGDIVQFGVDVVENSKKGLYMYNMVLAHNNFSNKRQVFAQSRTQKNI